MLGRYTGINGIAVAAATPNVKLILGFAKFSNFLGNQKNDDILSVRENIFI